MFSTTEIFNRLSKHFSEEAALTIASAITDVYDGFAEKLTDFDRLATKDEVNELRDAIKQLTKAQSRTEERLNQLTEVQSRTEERINQLVEAQSKTEKRLDQLAEAQIQLAEAQMKTEEELAKLTLVVGRVQKQFGGLSDSIGFMLEDRAFSALPTLLKDRFGIKVQGRLIRTFLKNAQGKNEEVNIYGKGLKDGSELVIIGESKSQLSKKHISKFKKKLARLEPVLGTLFPLMITYMAEPEVLSEAETDGIPVFMSYEFT